VNNPSNKKYILLGIFFFCSVMALAQGRSITISGHVRDAKSGEPMTQAIIYTEDKKTGVAADVNGFYSLSIPAGKQKIYCAYFGYKTEEAKVEDVSGSLILDFLLQPDPDMLEAATIFSHPNREEIKLPQMGLQRVDASLVRQLPAMMGEADIIRIIQMMPGVQSPSEGSTGFSVRGGGLDQNLILLDGAPIYNCGHFLGFLSMFNGDVIRGADLYKGDFPASYGGRLSSVLDISTKDGNNQKFGGNASIGLISSKLFLEGPIVPGKLSFMLAGRRTYLELFLPLAKGSIPEGTNLYFYDLNGKISWKASEKDHIFLSAFSGQDLLALKIEEFGLGLSTFVFANHTQSLRWNHIYSPKLTSDIIVYNTLYRNNMSFDLESAEFDFYQAIRETGFRAGWTWYPDKNNTMKAGIQTAWFNIEPGVSVPSKETSYIHEVHIPEYRAILPALYIQNEQKLGPLSLRYGLRFAWFTRLGPTEQRYYDPETHELIIARNMGRGYIIKRYGGLEPRFSASLSITDDLSAKVSYNRSYQYLQQARVSITGSPIDAWFAASPNLKPQRTDMFSLGLDALVAKQAVRLSLEGFYKYNKNTMDFIDNPGLVIDDVNAEGLLRTGTSRAYGVEAMIKYDFSRWNGWLSYTWSNCMYHIPEINDGVPYQSPLNHEHAVNFVLTYDFSKQLSASTEWVFYSGAPTTYPIGRYQFMDRWVRIYSTRNTDRMPDYHRLDLSLTWRTKRRVADKPWSAEWNLSIYNAYARHNAWSIGFHYDALTQRAQAEKTYLFTILPSISCNIKF
jgi:hypothetical protein